MMGINGTLCSFLTVAALAVAFAPACAASSQTGSDGSQTNGSGASSGSDVGAGGLAFSGSGGNNVGGFNNSGGAGTGGEDECAETSSDAQQTVLPADIIVVVDNSGSMTLEAADVQASMNDFVTAITTSGIDAHVVLISSPSNDDNGICIPAPLGSGSCPADENLPVYRHVSTGVGSNNGLSKILDTYSQWKDSLRANASKTVLVVTDDDSSMNSATFSASLVALDATFAGFKFSAIASPKEPPTAACVLCAATGCGSCSEVCCDKSALCIPIPAAEGDVYKDLVSQTGGMFGDICSQNFQPLFQDIATAVVAESLISCVYDIPPAPGDEAIDYDKVNVDYIPMPGDPAQPIYYVPGGEADCDAQGGWYYDDVASPTQILLCPATCDAVQMSTEGSVTVKFGCKTLIGPPE